MLAFRVGTENHLLGRGEALCAVAAVGVSEQLLHCSGLITRERLPELFLPRLRFHLMSIFVI